VRVEADEQTDGVIFKVIDSGRGVPAEQKQTLFHSVQPGQAGGVGIGLLIVHRAISAQGGTLGVESTPRERGPSFRSVFLGSSKHRTRRALDLITIPARAAAVSATEISPHHGLGFINRQASALQLGAVKRRDCFFGATFFFHYNKAKTLRAACIPIRDDTDRFHSPALLKCSCDFLFRRLKRQISNKQFFRHLFT
jgi:hypothetical protein